MSDQLSDVIISATAPAQVAADGDTSTNNMIDTIIDDVANSSGGVRNKRSLSLCSMDNDQSGDFTVVLKKPRGRPARPPKTAITNPTAVPKGDKLHGKKPKEASGMTGCNSISATSATKSDSPINLYNVSGLLQADYTQTEKNV